MKKLLIFLLTIMLVYPTIVKADEIYWGANISTNSKSNVGDEIQLKITTPISGVISYDTEILQYVEFVKTQEELGCEATASAKDENGKIKFGFENLNDECFGICGGMAIFKVISIPDTGTTDIAVVADETSEGTLNQKSIKNTIYFAKKDVEKVEKKTDLETTDKCVDKFDTNTIIMYSSLGINLLLAIGLIIVSKKKIA